MLYNLIWTQDFHAFPLSWRVMDQGKFTSRQSLKQDHVIIGNYRNFEIIVIEGGWWVITFYQFYNQKGHKAFVIVVYHGMFVQNLFTA